MPRKLIFWKSNVICLIDDVTDKPRDQNYAKGGSGLIQINVQSLRE